MQKMFETNVNQVDGTALLSAVSLLMHPIFNMSSFNWMTVSKPTLYQKLYKLVVITQSWVIDFTGANT